MSLNGHGTKVGRRTAAFLYKLTQLQDVFGLWFPNWEMFSEKKVTLVPSSINFRNSHKCYKGTRGRARNNAALQNSSLTFKCPLIFGVFLCSEVNMHSGKQKSF